MTVYGNCLYGQLPKDSLQICVPRQNIQYALMQADTLKMVKIKLNLCEQTNDYLRKQILDWQKVNEHSENQIHIKEKEFDIQNKFKMPEWLKYVIGFGVGFGIKSMID